MSQAPDPVEKFIRRWEGQEGGAERANYAMFLSELCDIIGVPRPHPAQATTAENDYVFERAVKLISPDDSTSNGRIDLYKRGCFVLEAKQSRLKGGTKALQGSLFPDDVDDYSPRRSRTRQQINGSNVMMMNARHQAEAYARALPVEHGWPPFILVCDVGREIEVRADFSGQGKNYAQFPDRQGFRITIHDLRRKEVRERLRLIWTDPKALDPSLQTAKVTRDIARELAKISRALEEQDYKPDRVAMFLMRCLFTMFAEDTALLPEKSFKGLLEECEKAPASFVPLVEQLWEAMDKGDFAYAIKQKVRRFNGAFFKKREVLPLKPEQIAALKSAAGYDWKEVDPSIFGTLLEQALEAKERQSLGAHYTPRAYVERLVVATIIEPLRADWTQALATAERQQSEGREKEAFATIETFHKNLCKLRILDPACGTGNFLYVSLELLKRLEGEVLDALFNFRGNQKLAELSDSSVDPHQFLGLELNPRAAGIAELVLWIGYLQWHFRTEGGFPTEPILRDFKNIEQRDAVLDNSGTTPRRPEWPEADFIVGNPPFIGGKDIRARLGDAYTEALWAAHPEMNNSADFVMYWWDHAATLLARKGSPLRRFGFVTTNSITQVFQRRVVERHLTARVPVSLVHAIPDHPWTKALPDSAAVRIAMTVAELGKKEGVLEETTHESWLETDAPVIQFSRACSRINADLTVGVDITRTRELKANEGLCSPGVKLHGDGFIVSPEKAVELGLGKREGLEAHIRDYRNGRDLTAHARGVMVIDLFGLQADEVRLHFPEVYQHLLQTVKPERDANRDADIKQRWWLFGRTRDEIRPALEGLPRYIATVETTKHRVFQFLDASILPDNKLIAVASDDAFHLGILSSGIHFVWLDRAGGLLEDRPVYVKTSCFDPFPFPNATEAQRRRIRVIAEELDAHRKSVLADKTKNLTLTGLYNVREAIRQKGVAGLDEKERRVMEDGLVLILNELHDRLDAAVAEAYGWDTDLPEAEILSRLVALNKARLAEEARGKVLWLRPEYQIPRFGTALQKLDLLGTMREQAQEETTARKPFPASEMEQTAEIMALLANAPAALEPGDILAHFKPGKTVRPKVDAVLAGLVRMGLAGKQGNGYSFRRAG
jgi:type I restriction-modification system DNA methylase subunit